MADNSKTVRRILHFKMRTPTAETKQLDHAILRERPRARSGFEVGSMDPRQPPQPVPPNSQNDETLMPFGAVRPPAGDPTLRAFLQTWRTLLAQAVEIDVYEDVTDSIE